MKNFGSHQNQKNESRPKTRRKLSPMIELFESRLMLDSALGYLAGTVFFDSVGSGQFSASDTVVKGATVELFKVGGTTPISSTVSDASGNYAFTSVAPGNYTLVETPPAGQTAINAQAISQINPASKASAKSIDVTVAAFAKAYVNYSGVTESTNSINANLTIKGTPEVNAISGLGVSLGTTAGATDLSKQFTSYCVDDLHEITFAGGQNWQVSLQSISTLSTNGSTPISSDASGRIAFLYNHFGNSSLTNIQEAGLQLAIWELEYDDVATPNFSAGNFQVGTPLSGTSQADLNSAIASATSYYNLSAGHSETAVLLSATSANNPTLTSFQSMIATQTYNFLNNNTPSTQLSSLSGFVYLDANNDGVFESTETPITGVTVTLTGTTTAGQSVSTTAVTDSTGAYHFANLTVGTYTITETHPAGYVDGKDTQGTPGTGTTVQNAFKSITLAPNVIGVNNNFGETLPVSLPSSLSGFVYLDTNNDGIFESTEKPISGVTISLIGATTGGQAVAVTTATDSTGAYHFSNLSAGTYSIIETHPVGYVDGKDTQGTPGNGTTVQDAFKSITLATNLNGVNNNFGETLPVTIAPAPSSLSGFVYCDANNDGVFESTEMPLSGVTVTLTGKTTQGQTVATTAVTDGSGAYHFLNLSPGVYSITETHPNGYIDGKDTQGTPGNGTTVQDAFNGINLAAGVNGVNNNFGETMVPVTVTNLTMGGVHMNPTVITVTFSGPVKPEQAQNAANYTLISLGKDETYGTADDRYVAIKSIVYNAASRQVTIHPSHHLNLHYHYILAVKLPSDACTPRVKSVQIFGRSSVPIFNNHGIDRPAPKMTPKEIEHNAYVVAKTKQTLSHRGLIR